MSEAGVVVGLRGVHNGDTPFPSDALNALSALTIDVTPIDPLPLFHGVGGVGAVSS